MQILHQRTLHTFIARFHYPLTTWTGNEYTVADQLRLMKMEQLKLRPRHEHTKYLHVWYRYERENFYKFWYKKMKRNKNRTAAIEYCVFFYNSSCSSSSASWGTSSASSVGFDALSSASSVSSSSSKSSAYNTIFY